MSEVKFTEEEMKSLNEVRETYIGIQTTFGQISVNKIRVEQDMMKLDEAETSLRNKYVENRETEKKLVQEITKKYGDGQLNFETGTFTPVETKESNTDQK